MPKRLIEIYQEDLQPITVNVYCDRIGFEVQETMMVKFPKTLNDIDLLLRHAEQQHMGQCGTKKAPCDAEANSWEVDSWTVECK